MAARSKDLGYDHAVVKGEREPSSPIPAMKIATFNINNINKRTRKSDSSQYGSSRWVVFSAVADVVIGGGWPSDLN